MATTDAPQPLWHNRDYLGWWVGSTVSGLGSSMSAVAYPLLMLLETGSAARAGIVAAATGIGALATVLFGGALADRYSRRTILMAGPLLEAIAVATVVAAVLLHHVTVWHVGLVGALQGAISGLTSGASTPALRRIVPSAQLPNAFAQLNGRGMAIRLIGPSAGGALFGIARWVPFAADALSFLAATIGIAFVRTPLGPDIDEHGPRVGIFRSIGEGLRFIRGNAYMRYIAVWASLMNMCGSGLLLLVVVIIHQRGGAPALVGAVNSIGAAGGIVGALLCKRIIQRFSGRFIVLTVGWFIVAGFAGVALAHEPWLVGLSLATFMVFVVPINVVFSTYEARAVPDELLGRVTSAIDFGAGTLRWVGPLGVGLLASAWNPTGAGLVLVVIVATLAITSHFARGLDLLDKPAPVDAAEPITA